MEINQLHIAININGRTFFDAELATDKECISDNTIGITRTALEKLRDVYENLCIKRGEVSCLEIKRTKEG